jgi:hypothetical protein
MTQRYAHLAQENLRAAVLKLDAMDSEVSTILAQCIKIKRLAEMANLFISLEPALGFEPRTC